MIFKLPLIRVCNFLKFYCLSFISYGPVSVETLKISATFDLRIVYNLIRMCNLLTKSSSCNPDVFRRKLNIDITVANSKKTKKLKAFFVKMTVHVIKYKSSLNFVLIIT